MCTEMEALISNNRTFKKKTKITPEVLHCLQVLVCFHFTDESSTVQSSEPALSSRCTSDKTKSRKKGCSYPPVHSNSTTSLVISKHKECPGKRKRNSLETSMKNSQKPVVQRLDKYNFSTSLEKHDSNYSKDRVSPNDQLESMNLSNSDSLVSLEWLTAEENGKTYYCTMKQNDQTENINESQIQTFRPLFNLEKMAGLPQEVNAKASHNDLVAPQKDSLFSKHSKDIVSHIQRNKLFESLEMQVPSSSCDLNKMNDEDSSPSVCLLNKVRSLSFGEDKTSDDSLDSSDEEELLPLEKILAQSFKPPPKGPEQTNDGDDTTDSPNDPVSG